MPLLLAIPGFVAILLALLDLYRTASASGSRRTASASRNSALYSRDSWSLSPTTGTVPKPFPDSRETVPKPFRNRYP